MTTNSQAAGRIGVIGGGQLARMMVVPAINLGLDIRVLAESAGSSAAIAASMVGDYKDQFTVDAFAADRDVITFDHEHVPLAVLRQLEGRGVSVQPPAKALAVAQNKLVMRRALAELGLPVPRWAEVRSAGELEEFIAANGGRAVVKTPIGGYDGRGVRVVAGAAEAADWLSADRLPALGGSLLVEELVPFSRELAQLAARSTTGEFAAWPVVETTQRGGVCARVVAPAPAASQQLRVSAREIAQRVAAGLGVTGVLAVELFETTTGDLLINELAMRPHNSGHFSIEGSVTSQFEQHLRAVLGLPLGSTEMRGASVVMENLLGPDDHTDLARNLPAALSAVPVAKVHLYGKGPRAGRKLGHLTVVGDELAPTLAQARAAAEFLLAAN